MDIAVGIDAPQQNIAAGIVAHKNNSGCAEVKSVCQHIPRSQPRTFTPIPHWMENYLLMLRKC